MPVSAHVVVLPWRVIVITVIVILIISIRSTLPWRLTGCMHYAHTKLTWVFDATWTITSSCTQMSCTYTGTALPLIHTKYHHYHFLLLVVRHRPFLLHRRVINVNKIKPITIMVVVIVVICHSTWTWCHRLWIITNQITHTALLKHSTLLVVVVLSTKKLSNTMMINKWSKMCNKR